MQFPDAVLITKPVKKSSTWDESYLPKANVLVKQSSDGSYPTKSDCTQGL